MTEKKDGWIDIGELLPQVSIPQIAAHFRFDLGELFGTSGEQRTRCPVVSCDGHDNFRSVSVNMDSDTGAWKCHRGSYGCGAQGDKLTFAYCLEHGVMPADGKLKGEAFRSTARLLARIVSGEPPMAESSTPNRNVASPSIGEPSQEDHPNSPFTSENLLTLDQHFVYDPAAMSRHASRYVRSRPWLTAELQQGVRCGYCPKNVKSIRRSQFVYAVLDEAGEPLAWTGRRMFDAADPAQVAEIEEKGKYVFPAKQHFRRKFELYGQEDLAKPEYAETLQQLGLVVVEGFNDRLRLKSLGIPAVAIMSNQITQEQVQKLIRFAEKYCDGRVWLMWDCNHRGEAGAKDSLWQIAQTGVNVGLVWSRSMHAGKFADREPESLSEAEWDELAVRLV